MSCDCAVGPHLGTVEGAVAGGVTKHAATIKVMPAGGNPIVRVGDGAKAVGDSAQGQPGTW